MHRPVHPVTATCDRLDIACACSVFVAANPTSAACFYVGAREIMAKVIAALPQAEEDAVTAAAAVRMIAAQPFDGFDVGTAAARHHLVLAVADHLVACRLTPGGRYRLWAPVEDSNEERVRWGLAEGPRRPTDTETARPAPGS